MVYGSGMATFQELFVKHGTDKGNPHMYGPVYDMLFTDRTAVRSVLEIGVYKGNSLRAWAEGFPNAFIWGIDKEYVDVRHDRIRTVQLNQADVVGLREWADGKRFDLIVDDGSHWLKDILTSLFVLWPRLYSDGVYIVEELGIYEGSPGWWRGYWGMWPGAFVTDTISVGGAIEPLYGFRKW